MTLHGPANPDAFRVKVGRFRDGHYFDPLPADKTWGATQDVWPAVSTIKRADREDWSSVSLERAARYIASKPHDLDGLEFDEIKERLNAANKRGLRKAGERGTAIHKVAEEIGSGTYDAGLELLNVDARPYVPAIQAFMDDHKPEFVLAEGVVINRALGYGGTFDAIITIAGKTYLVDWKTRSKEHGAYPEEGAQLAAYANADYVIVEESGTAYRQTLPTLDGYLIISLHPSGYRLYPVSEAKAWRHFTSLLEWWTVKRDAHDIVEKPVLLSKPVGAVKKTRAKKIADGTPSELGHRQCTGAGADIAPEGRGAGQPGAALLGFPSEGPVLPDMAAALLKRLKALPDLQRAVAYRWAKEATAAGLWQPLLENPSQRRCEVARSLVAWAPRGDAALRALLHGADGIPTGEIVARLTIEQAKALADEALR